MNYRTVLHNILKSMSPFFSGLWRFMKGHLNKVLRTSTVLVANGTYEKLKDDTFLQTSEVVSRYSTQSMSM